VLRRRTGVGWGSRSLGRLSIRIGRGLAPCRIFRAEKRRLGNPETSAVAERDARLSVRFRTFGVVTPITARAPVLFAGADLG
jgi:hypothetical protein